jgi:hypothetical protein
VIPETVARDDRSLAGKDGPGMKAADLLTFRPSPSCNLKPKA